MPHGRTSTAAAQANAVMRRHPDCSEGRRRLVARSPHGHEQPVRTTDATGRGPQAPRSYERYLVDLYNLRRPHQALGWRTPDEAYLGNRAATAGPRDTMPSRCCGVDSRLRRSRLTAQARSPEQAGENAFPHLAHRSAAAHKLHCTTATTRYEFDSGKVKPSVSASSRPLRAPASRSAARWSSVSSSSDGTTVTRRTFRREMLPHVADHQVCPGSEKTPTLADWNH